MLKLSNVDVLETLRKFRQYGVKVAFLVPTATGLEKSIMDATEDIRKFLGGSGIHAFDEQPQGPEHKRIVPTNLVSGEGVFSTKTSLYRPETKSGDPRIWIYDLTKHAGAGDLLALTKSPEGLTVINCSKTNLDKLLKNNVAEVLPSASKDASALLASMQQVSLPLIVPEIISSKAFKELLEKLRGVSSKGYVMTLRPGDTGVGYTLESMLGIQANSSKAPDYYGIEIKSGRSRTHAAGQTTVFSQVPNWQISRLKGSKDLLWTRGKYNESKGRQQLFHEISAVSPNSYGLKLEMDYPSSLMHQVFISGSEKETDVSWAIEKLKSRLLEKHHETVWVTAQCKGGGENEEFWYDRLKHTESVDAEALPLMLETGAISIHYTIKETPTGGAKDQGYLFKTSPKNLDLLFTKVEQIDL